MDGTKLRSQELEPAFALNGSIYLIDPNQLREARTFFTEDVEAIVTNQAMASIDIDTEFDWLIAEAIAAACRTQ
jgi:CMP-N-acetylneuraminic acid synthetase